MKITKQQLKQIIKEEITKVLLESSGAGEAHDAGYEDGSRGLDPKDPGDMDYMAGYDLGEEDAQYDIERARSVAGQRPGPPGAFERFEGVAGYEEGKTKKPRTQADTDRLVRERRAKKLKGSKELMSKAELRRLNKKKA